MKIVEIYPVWDFPPPEGKMRYEVAYKMRGQGNVLFYEGFMARDEMEAFKLARRKALWCEKKHWEAVVADMELLCNKMPKAGWQKRLSNSKRTLSTIRKELGEI